ncbi:MAG: ABC transporter permease [Paludibacter sp.]|jgi:lipoprotein-releasing system permease protein|nr:ABC transporter permease [Paludibacter sp.]
MSVEYFIAKRIHFQSDKKNVSRPAIRIATFGVALGMAVMIITVAVVLGFKREVRNKAIGFGGHIQIVSRQNTNNYETLPITFDSAFIDKIRKIDGVKKVEFFATNPGLVKTDNAFQGIVLKGVESDFDWSFFRNSLLEGELPNANADSLQNRIIISKYLANLLELKLGDSFFTYFISEQVKARKFVISGIYSTNFVEYDKLFLLTDIRHIQTLNAWDRNEYSGIEILIHDFERMDELAFQIRMAVVSEPEIAAQYYVQTIRDINPQIFAWLDLLDLNVWIILGLLLAVAGFTMVSGLLILVLERTQLIGIIKSLGATNRLVRKIFIYNALFLTLKGMLWGNIIGLAICAIQYYTNIIPMFDPESYYVVTVPIAFNWLFISLLNLGTFIVSFIMMLFPSYVITKIYPAQIIRYE